MLYSSLNILRQIELDQALIWVCPMVESNHAAFTTSHLYYPRLAFLERSLTPSGIWQSLTVVGG